MKIRVKPLGNNFRKKVTADEVHETTKPCFSEYKNGETESEVFINRGKRKKNITYDFLA